MSLNPASCASSLESAMSAIVADYLNPSSFHLTFAATYKAYSQAGVLSAGGGAPGTESEGILSSFMSSVTNSPSTVHEFAVALADYWATCLLVPVAPATGLVNNAGSLVAAFEAAINASYTTSNSQPYYLNLIQNIQTMAVSSIVWTVTLSVPPFVRNETVS